MAAEARTMEYARSHGYPVPAVEEISTDGTELVMERVHGPSMATSLSRRPWTMRRQAAVLAELHHRLHDIEAPDWVPTAPGGEGRCLVHLDLHPLNVLIADNGPVVIDWSTASRGIGDVDVTLVWVLLACGEMPYGRLRSTAFGRGRAFFTKAFLSHFDVATVRRHLSDVVAWKVTDPNMSESERRAMCALADSARPV